MMVFTQQSLMILQGPFPIVPDYGAGIAYLPIEVLDPILDCLIIEDVVHVSMVSTPSRRCP